MAISKLFLNANSDYAWIGRRSLNTSFDPDYIGTPGSLGFDPLKYYRYVPQNLDYRSDLRLLTFIQDVNWDAPDRAGHSNTTNPVKDWNSITSRVVDQAKVELVQQQWGNVINLNNVNATISFAYASIGEATDDPVGVTYVGGDNTSIGGLNYKNQYAILLNDDKVAGPIAMGDLSIGTWGGWVVMHEIGHVLGLFHGRDDPTPGSNSRYDLRDSILWYPQTTNSDTKIPLTPGMKDIDVLQQKFGESKAQDNDTTYKFTPTSIQLGQKNQEISIDPGKAVMTLWDRKATAGDTKGGIDTIDASEMTTNVYITLEDGEFSSIGSNINTAPTTGGNVNLKGDPDGGTTYNVGIAVGAQIENAKGGSGNDYCQSASKTFH